MRFKPDIIKTQLSIKEWTALREIANLCPLIYGKYFYKAQILLSMHCDYHFPDLYEACQVIVGKKGKATVSTGEINCYPNPSTGLFTLTFPESEDTEEKTYEVEIRNSLGRLCYKSVFTNPTLNEEINLANNSSGIYYLNVKESAEKVLHKKLIILK